MRTSDFVCLIVDLYWCGCFWLSDWTGRGGRAVWLNQSNHPFREKRLVEDLKTIFISLEVEAVKSIRFDRFLGRKKSAIIHVYWKRNKTKVTVVTNSTVLPHSTSYCDVRNLCWHKTNNLLNHVVPWYQKHYFQLEFNLIWTKSTCHGRTYLEWYRIFFVVKISFPPQAKSKNSIS